MKAVGIVNYLPVEDASQSIRRSAVAAVRTAYAKIRRELLAGMRVA